MRARLLISWLVFSSGLFACGEEVPNPDLSPGDEQPDPDGTGSKDDDDDDETTKLDAGKRPAGKADASKPLEAGSSDAAAVDSGAPRVDGGAPRADAGQASGGSDASVGADGGADGGAAPDAALDAGSAGDASVAADASGPVLPPFPTDGEPLSAPARKWTYIEFPDTKCRDGSPAGLSVSLNASSKNLLLYLEGGGGCFDANTCNLASSANVDGTNLNLSAPGTGANINSARTALTEGIFDRANPENPIRDWNIVYVPYCTGDTHAGNQEVAVDVPGLLAPRRQWFVGQSNIKKFLNRIVPTFPDVEDVLLAGVSAGGYGTLSNLYLVQRAFPNVKVKHVNDSGAPLSKEASPECLQKKFRELWKVDLSPCGSACPNPNDYTQDNALWVAKFFADRPGGFIDTTEDGIISLFLGTGLNNCTGTFGVSQVPAATYRKEILAYADKLKPFANYGAFTPSGTNHTYLRTANFYTATAGGVRLVDWFTKIIRGEAPGQARD
jgi:Pectinacetylesterase